MGRRRSPEPEFFPLTKRLHNLIHGVGEPRLSAADRTLYERVSARLAAELLPRLADGDVAVVHDPQPLGAGARVRSSRRMTAHVFRRREQGVVEAREVGRQEIPGGARLRKILVEADVAAAPTGSTSCCGGATRSAFISRP